MQTSLIDPLLPAHNLFLDFVEAASGDITDASARSLLTKARSSLRDIGDETLMSYASQANEPALTDEVVRVTGAIARLESKRAAAWFSAGLALQLAKRHADAVQPYRRALAIKRTFPNLRNNLAVALTEIKSDDDELLTLLEECIAADPNDINAWINISRLLPGDTDTSRALEAGRHALTLAPDNLLLLNNYAAACKESQLWDEAERTASSACQYAPNKASLRFNLSMLQLLRGKFAEGWRNHEIRWEGAPELAAGRPAFTKPHWHGEPLAGRTLLVWGEQGIGDLLQFCRYVPLLAERVHREGGRLVWNSFPQIGALLARSLGSHCDLYSNGGPVESLPPHDCEVSMMSLPLIFGTEEATIPGPTGYLKPEPGAAARWREQLGGEKRLKVGLAWTGSLVHSRNPYRRVGLDRLARHFAGIEGVAFYSLQPGAKADVAAARKAGLKITDFSPQWQTMDDTAAFVDSLDLVISVCTSAAHLAGALGKRTWVLLDVNPHWVWQLERRDSPWYPNTTLYRQKAFKNWEPVLEEVSADLAALARGA